MNGLFALIVIPAVLGVLPPGSEDTAWCPPASCLQNTNKIAMISGPRSMFVECYDPMEDLVVDEVWTGSKTEVSPPGHWLEASPCAQSTGTEYRPSSVITAAKTGSDVGDESYRNDGEFISFAVDSALLADLGTIANVLVSAVEQKFSLEDDDTQLVNGDFQGFDIDGLLAENHQGEGISEISASSPGAESQSMMELKIEKDGHVASEYEYEYEIVVLNILPLRLLSHLTQLGFLVCICAIGCRCIARHRRRRARTLLPTTEQFVHAPVLVDCHVVQGTDASFTATMTGPKRPAALSFASFSRKSPSDMLYGKSPRIRPDHSKRDLA